MLKQGYYKVNIYQGKLMFKTVITIVGNGLNKEKAIELLTCEAIGDIETNILKSNYAIDFFIKGDSPQLISSLYKKLLILGKFDIFIQDNDEFRKKQLLVSDMDATIIKNETLNDIAKEFNLADKIIPLTEKSMRGELDFGEALKFKVSLLKGIYFKDILKFLEAVEYSNGAESLIKTMNKFEAKSILISGGFDIFTQSVAKKLGFFKNFGNKLELKNNKLTGEVTPPILGKESKEQILVEESEKLGLDLKHVMAVGDGANDILMLKKAGAGVGYFAKPLVIEATPYQIRYTNLTSLLYMQGYQDDEIL